MAGFYCEYCGRKGHSVQWLTGCLCSKSPTKYCSLYEGSEKKEYTCKYCGRKGHSIQWLTGNLCSKSPTKHCHPALN